MVYLEKSSDNLLRLQIATHKNELPKCTSIEQNEGEYSQILNSFIGRF